MKGLGAFLTLTRPHFLGGGILLFALGAAGGGGDIEWPRYFIAQAMVTTAQVTAHYVNEYFDLEADRHVQNRTIFSGGSGALAGGALEPRVALRAAIAASALAIGVALVVATWSWQSAILGSLALAVSWAYSAQPVRLLNTGWGEAATSVVVTVIVPVIGAWSNAGSITGYLGWAVVALLPIHMAMMLAFELPDLATDGAAGKTVLAVRIGEPATHRLIGAFYVASYLALLGGAVFSHHVVAFGAAGAVALVPTAVALLAARARRYSLLTAGAVLSLAGPALALLAAAPGAPGG